MSKLKSKFNTARLLHINYVMSQIHDSVDDLYEALVDRDFDTLRTSIVSLNKTLKDIEDSLRDET